MFMSRCGLALVALCLSVQFPLAAGRAAAPGSDLPSVLASCCSEMQLADDRAVSRRPHQSRGRDRRPAQRLLHRRRQRRRLEDRPTTAAPGSRSSTTSPPARSAPSPSRHPIPTSSTSAAAKGCSVPTSPPATASTNPPTPARPGRTSACATGSRSRRSSSIRSDPNRLFVAVLGHPYGANERARHLPLDRRRRDVREGALQGREHRRASTWSSIPRTRHRLRRAVGGAAGAVGERRVQRPRQRPLQVDRRRHHVEAADERSADVRGATASAASASAIAPSDPRRLFATVEAEASRRALSIGRRRRELDAGQRRPARHRPRRRLRRGAASIRTTRTSSTSPAS